MKTGSQRVYRFGDFKFDARRLALYHKNELIKNVEKKSLEVLAALMRKPNRVITHDEIIDQVWNDNSHGVTALHINQYVSKLRKAFAKYEPDRNFIETLKGRGYAFRAELEPETEESGEFRLGNTEASQPTQNAANENKKGSFSRTFLTNRFLIFVALTTLSIAAALWGFYPHNNDEEEIRRVVKESQMFESLVLYKNPTTFKEEDFDKYWTAELDVNTNYDRRRIREAVKKMIDEGRRYGDETKCEQFEFQSVEIDKTGKMALVKTLEKWFVAVYFSDGTLQKNKYIGPYFVSYIVRKVDGRWLIEKSNTARVNRPTPVVTKIEPVSEMRAGMESYIRLIGQDFEIETVFIQVIGPGCPEAKPCRVPNDVLRGYAKISETSLDKVPVTLASGEFQIVVHNGDSKPSVPVNLVVP